MKRAILLGVLLAGCAAPAPALHERAPDLTPTVDHDHTVAAGHHLAWNLELHGSLPLRTLFDDPGARASDVQLHEDLAIVTVNGGEGGFVVVDVTDPSAPVVVSRYRSGTNDNWYTKVTPDGRYVLLTANANLAPQGATGVARGIHVVDLTDPSAPRLASIHPWPVRAVNLAIGELAGGTFVFASMMADQFGATREGHVQVLRLDEGRLVPVARWKPASPFGAVVFPHDLALDDGILYASAWDAGAYLVDVSDPAAPRELGHWRPDGFPARGLQVHSVKPNEGLVDGRKLALATVETFGGEPSGGTYLLDVADPTTPTLLSEWRLPGDLVNDEPLLWSPHEPAFVGGRAYTTHFHGGLVMLDARNGTLAPVAAWARAAPEAGPHPRWAVDITTAVPRDGLVFAVDMGAGLLVLREA